jgi:threonine/homoserine/homoserine lactone efflux protein
MHSAAFWASLWIGLSIAAPVGPIGLLVIQRTLRDGRAAGLATGLGAAAADGVYGAVGAYGVSALIGALQGLRVPLVLLGGALLLRMAWTTWHAAATTAEVRLGGASSRWSAFAATFALTLSNPSTILSFIAVFGAMAGGGAPAQPALMVLGVLLGSALWWLMLSTAVGSLRGRVDARWQRRIGQASAAMLAGFALWQWAVLLAGA